MCTIYSNVFFLLSLSKVPIVLYANQPYEKRLNLSPTSFRRLVDSTGDILEYYYHVEQDCLRGKPVIQPLMVPISMDHNLYAVVTSYRVKGKIHLGSRAYCEILMTKVEDAGYTLSPPKDHDRSIPVVLFEELDEMHCRVETAWTAQNKHLKKRD